jgi:hypothetical protein
MSAFVISQLLKLELSPSRNFPVNKELDGIDKIDEIIKIENTIEHLSVVPVYISPREVICLCMFVAAFRLGEDAKEEYFNVMNLEIAEFPNKGPETIINICTSILTDFIF